MPFAPVLNTIGPQILAANNRAAQAQETAMWSEIGRERYQYQRKN
jgi:hypothetical protein